MVGGLGPSDSTLKENIEPLENTLDKIQHINGYTYTWKEDAAKKPDIGLVAQDLEKVFPEMVVDDTVAGHKKFIITNLFRYYWKLLRNKMN